MGFIRIICDKEEPFNAVVDVFKTEDDFVNYNNGPAEWSSLEMTFFGDQDEVAEKYAELCKRFPKDRISMSHDDDEGLITYYDNEDGWGHEDWIEEYDVEEEEE